MQCALLAVCVSALVAHGRAFMGEPSTVDVVRSYGYKAEELNVVTADGYILTLTHIKSAATKLPVLMIHGVIAASDQWVLRGPKEDLALLLVDEGHDVWLGDQRGNHYSRKHTFLNVSQPEFWDFSFHESGLYDVAAFIDRVLQHSGTQQLYYVGHSMGTSAYYVLCSLRPEYNRKIHTAVHLAPVAFGLQKSLSPSLQLMLSNAESIAEGLRSQNVYDFMPKTPTYQLMIDDMCTDRSKSLCVFTFSQLFGPETYITNTTQLRYYLKRLQSGTSVKMMLHLGQIFKTKNFAQFDYGKKQNYEVYKTKYPPLYPLEKITSPIALFYSDKDNFVDESSIDRLSRLLPNVVESVSIPKYNHVDLIFADNAPKILFKNIVKLLSKQ